MAYSGEQQRFHAAGHIAAAVFLAEADEPLAASKVLTIVGMFLDGMGPNCPAELKRSIAANIQKPNAKELRSIHEIFVDEINTQVERG